MTTAVDWDAPQSYGITRREWTLRRNPNPWKSTQLDIYIAQPQAANMQLRNVNMLPWAENLIC